MLSDNTTIVILHTAQDTSEMAPIATSRQVLVWVTACFASSFPMFFCGMSMQGIRTAVPCWPRPVERVIYVCMWSDVAAVGLHSRCIDLMSRPSSLKVYFLSNVAQDARWPE